MLIPGNNSAMMLATQCDPTWQVALRSSETEFGEQLYNTLTL